MFKMVGKSCQNLNSIAVDFLSFEVNTNLLNILCNLIVNTVLLICVFQEYPTSFYGNLMGVLF